MHNTYLFSIGKKLIHADYSAFSEEFDSIHKAAKYNADNSGFLSIRTFLAKFTSITDQEKYL